MAPSAVWVYCKKIENGSKVRCNECNKVFRFNKSTSTLMNHLRSVHKIQLLSNDDNSRKRPADCNATVDENCLGRPVKKLMAIKPPSTINVISDDVIITPKSSSSLLQLQNKSDSKHSGPIDRCINNANSFSAGGHRHKAVTNALIRMIAVDNMPLCTPERRGFKFFIQTIQPLYRLPCEATITTAMNNKYKQLSYKIKLELQKVKSLCLTTDLWTHQYTMKSYLGLTVHYVEGIEMKTIELGAYLMNDRKTIINLACKLSDICAEWGIEREKIAAIVSDGGYNIKGAIKKEFGESKHITCFAHVINNIGQKLIEINVSPPASESAGKSVELCLNENDVSDSVDDSVDESNLDSSVNSPLRDILLKVKKIVTFFRQSERATTELDLLQQSNGNSLKLVQEVKTRWNSCFEMIDRFILLADYVSKVLLQVKIDKSSRTKPPNMITGEEIDALIEVRDILRPLCQVTKEVCLEKTITLSKCIPLISGLKNKINSLTPVTLVGQQLQKKFSQELEKKYGNIESVNLYACATLLDPRFKKYGFQNIRECARAITTIGDLVKSEIKEQTTVQVDAEEREKLLHEACGDNQDILSYIDEAISNNLSYNDSDEAGGLPITLRQYLTRPAVDRKLHNNPLIVWHSMKHEYPALWKVAEKFLPIVASSVPCERLFSHAGLIANQLRSRLSPQHLNKLIFLRSIEDKMWLDE